MKTHTLILILLFAFLNHSCSDKHAKNSDSSFKGLLIFEDNYPQSFFFRVSEKTYEPCEEWESDMNRLAGIMGKVMEEELTGLGEQSIYFVRFISNYQSKTVRIIKL